MANCGVLYAFLAILCSSCAAQQQHLQHQQQQCTRSDGSCGRTQGLAMLQQKHRLQALKLAEDYDQDEESESEGQVTEDELQEAESDSEGQVAEDALQEELDFQLRQEGEYQPEEKTAELGEGEKASLVEEASDAGGWPGIQEGTVLDYPDLDFVKQPIWYRGACCAGKRSWIAKAPTKGRKGWLGGGEASCAKAAADKGFTTFMINKNGQCNGVQARKCILSGQPCASATESAGYSIRNNKIPRVDNIWPKAGPVRGGQRVIVTGANLWAGPEQKNDMQEFTPPVTICLQNVPCEIDYFISTSTKVVCRSQFNSSEPPSENLTDPDVQASLTLSETMCKQIEKNVPGGHVFKQDEWIKTGTGLCDQKYGALLAFAPKITTLEACKTFTLKKGGKAFTWRKNLWKGKQPCWVWADYCRKPRRGHPVLAVYSLIPPQPAVFVKHHGEFVGGLVNQKWNEDSTCYGDPFKCSYTYDDNMAAKVVGVLPRIATPGDKITIIGSNLGENALTKGKVWLVSPDSPDDPVFCRTMDDDGKDFKMIYTSHKGQSYFNCVLPIGLMPGKYDVIVWSDNRGESLPFKSLSVFARIDTVERDGNDLTITGAHLAQVESIDISGTPCSDAIAEFGVLKCKLPKDKSYWDHEHYSGGMGAVIEKVTLGRDVEEAPEDFADAVIEAARLEIKPKFSISTRLLPPKAMMVGESKKVHYTRAKAFLKVPKSGTYMVRLIDRNHQNNSVTTLSVSGLQKAEGKDEHPTGQFIMTAINRKWPPTDVLAKFDADKLYPVQLERSHKKAGTLADVGLWLEPMDNRDRKIAFDAAVLFRAYDAPQVTGSNAMCANPLGCALPRTSSASALLQTKVRPRPAAPERGRRSLPKMMTIKELAGLRQSAPGLGLVERQALRIAAPVPGSHTTTADGSICYWGPMTLYGSFEGCVPGEKTGDPPKQKDGCNTYASLPEAQTACSTYDDCGGISKVVQSDKTSLYEIRKGRWLKSDLNAHSWPKLACGKWQQRAHNVGRDPEKRSCNLKDFQVEGEFGKDLETCKNFCMQSSPRRPHGLISTRFVEYHNDTYCACFSKCEFSRNPDAYASTSDVYEMVSPDINSTEEIPFLSRYKNNPCLHKVCAFSNTSTWGPSGVPSKNDTDIIYIPENVTLLLDQDVDIRYWVVEGSLLFARKDIYLKTEGLFINGGTMKAGTADEPFLQKLTFEVFGHWHTFKIPVFGSKAIGLTTGNLELYGKPINKTWVELAETAKPGASTLKVMGKEAAEWEPGSKIVVAATDSVEKACDSDRRDRCQTEELELLSTQADKDSDTTTLTIKQKLKYRHLVEVLTGKRGEDMSIRAEVGLLSRNIRVIGSQDVQGTQHFGAHVMMMKLDKVALEYVEFHHVGQAHQLGRYPVHFHHSGTLKDRAHVRGCAIHRTFNRAVTNHGTKHLLVENNVAYNVQGMCYFFEDAVETDAIYRNNLGVMIRQSFSLLQKDMTPAVFWVTNPNNHLINNHAAGSYSFGFWFDIHQGARGLSMGMEGYLPQGEALGTFLNNTAHSNERGLWITTYDPAEDGRRIPAVFEGTKTWGNHEGYEGLELGHIWLKRHVSISDGTAAVAPAVYFADVWGSENNKWNAPLLLDVTIKSKSQLPSKMWTECGVHGPTNDYITFKGLHVHDSFKLGFFCGCKWCPNPFAGGNEVRFSGTTFLSEKARSIRKGWRSSFDSYLHDADGTMSGEGRCHLHGCQIHPPISGGLGHFPPTHCKMQKMGIVCSANVALRTMRLRDVEPAPTKGKRLTVTTPYGSSRSSFYFYDFRRSRQGGGLYHITMVSGISHMVTWNMDHKDVDIDSFGGEICGLRKDEYFLWGTKTLANPVSFELSDKTVSLEKLALIGCPENCKKSKCLDFVDNDGICHLQDAVNRKACGGCRIEPNQHSNHRLIKIGVECGARDLPLGEHASVSECAAECAKKTGCKYFIFGHGIKKGRCYQETTESALCPEGFEVDMYDFYAVREPSGGENDTLAGVDFEDLNAQKGSNGLWQYTEAKESFDLDKWRAGTFNGLLNTQINGPFKNGKLGKFDGSEDMPASNWGDTQLSPCLKVDFARTEGAAGLCADDKDDKRFGMQVPPKELSWCSDEWESDEVTKWTRKSIWEKHDTIVIPGTWKVHFNCTELVKIKVLEIHGEVIFEDGADRSLQATHIMISYMGALRIGTEQNPFQNKVLIALEGHRRTPAWPGGELGSKFIASMGILDLYGQVKPTWTKLAKSVKSGEDTVETAKDLQLQEGDTVLVTPTGLDASQLEEREVKSVQGTKITFTKDLDHAHAGLDADHDGYKDTKGMMAGEVAVLRGNIVIKGLEGEAFNGTKAIEDEGWGANIKVWKMSASCTQAPTVHIQGVELDQCGKDNTHCIKVGSGCKGFIKNTVVHHGLGVGFMGGFAGIAAEGIPVSSNVVYHVPKGTGIMVKGPTTNNLVTGGGYGYDGIDGSGRFTDNVAAGMSKYQQFKKQLAVCAFVVASAPGKWRDDRNTFRTCSNGIISSGGSGKGWACARRIPANSAYPSSKSKTECGAVANMRVIHCTHMGIHSYGGTVIVDNMMFINTHKAVSHSGSGPLAHAAANTYLEVRNSKIYAKAGKCGGSGVAAGTWYEEWLRINKPLTSASLYGGTIVHDVTFYGFGDCSPALTNDVGAWSVPLHDAAHYSMFTSNLKFVGGSKKKLVSMQNSGARCVQMLCDGRRSSLMIDTDGSLIGKPGTVVARNEQAWNYKLLPHSMRFGSKGETIPNATLYSGKGAYRKGCKLDKDWNAWVCPDGQHRILLLESMDKDWLERRYAPVAVEVNDKNEPSGGYVGMYTGPGMKDITKQIQAFWTVAHIGLRHNIYFSSTNPIHTRVHLRDVKPDQACLLSVYYGLPNRVEVFIGKKRAHALAEPTWDDKKMPKLDTSLPNGANVYDRIGALAEDKRPGYLHVVVKGPQPIDLIVSKKIKLTQRLEVGEQEFVYKRGSQGLVRNLALLLNIPESRIKVVGLGSMKDGEIWGEHNGVKDGYKPPSLLETQKPELMQVVFDPPEAENEDEIEGTEEELVSVFNNAKQSCQKKEIKCLKPPEIDSLPVPGWKCDATKYDSDDGCDCDCGIWDPDCDKDSKFGYGAFDEEEKIKLFDTSRVEALLKGFDKSPSNHELEAAERFKINETLDAGNPLRALAHEIQEAGDKYVPLLKLASSETCSKGSKCLMNPKKVLTPKALPVGVCTPLPTAKPGSACDANPCGICSASKCIPSTSNSYGFQCVPTATKVAIVSKATGKVMALKYICVGRRQRRKCFWKLAQSDSPLTTGKFKDAGRGVYRGVVPFKKIPYIRSWEACAKWGAKNGAKAVGHSVRQKLCWLYKYARKRSWRRIGKFFRTYEVSGKEQIFELKPTASATTFQMETQMGGCLYLNKGSFSVLDCKGEKTKSWQVSQTCKEVGTLEINGQCVEAKSDNSVTSGTCVPHFEDQQITLVPMS